MKTFWKYRWLFAIVAMQVGLIVAKAGGWIEASWWRATILLWLFPAILGVGFLVAFGLIFLEDRGWLPRWLMDGLEGASKWANRLAWVLFAFVLGIILAERVGKITL